MPSPAELRADLAAFAVAVGMPLADWQAESLTLDRRTTIIQAPRQSGKSRALAVLALHRAFSNAGHHTLLVSAGEEASRHLLAQAADVALRSPLLAGSVPDSNSGLLTLSNGSEIRSVPASERQIRGLSIDTLLIDEASQLDGDLVTGAAIPTTAARPSAKIVMASSPGGCEGIFYSLATTPSEHVAAFTWSLTDATWIEPDVVEAAREQLAPAQFAREYLGIFSDVGLEERVVPREWIAAAQARTLEPGAPAFGLDVARSGTDSSVLLCVRGGTARVEWSHHGHDLMVTANRAAASACAERGPAPRILVDAIGLGAGVLDRLHEMGVANVTPFISSARAARPDRFLNLRAEAWWLTREQFRLGAVDLDPRDRELAEELGSVGYKLAANGAIQIQAKESMRRSPDRADALCIAIFGRAQHERGEQITRLLAEAKAEPLDPLLEGSTPIEQLDWNGERRGNWKQRMGWDPDLPIL
jgi:hypothetical protein